MRHPQIAVPWAAIDCGRLDVGTAVVRRLWFSTLSLLNVLPPLVCLTTVHSVNTVSLYARCISSSCRDRYGATSR
jgi:hypothetical protein